MQLKVDRSETLRYLGYKGGYIPEDVEKMLTECMEKIEEISNIRYVYKVFNLDEVTLKGNDITNHLEGCQKCILMAATIGMETDDYVKKMQVKDMTRAVMLDACGSSAIENVCNLVEEILREQFEYKGMYVTKRFSPGYGDMPIEQQREMCNLLDAQRKIGIYITDGNMIIPVKSVTAVLGISKTKPKNEASENSKCDSCNLKESCKYKLEYGKDGRTNCGE